MQRYVDEGTLPGALTLIARHGRVVYCECAGLMDIESRQPVQTDTIFRIYSMTKPITSVAVMMLYEENRFRLGEPVAEYLPEFADLKVFVDEDTRADLERPVTIHHLLTHTAGLTYGFIDDSPVDKMYQNAEVLRRVAPFEQVIAKLAEFPLVFQPGSLWRYSMAIDVLGYLVQVVSGMRFEDFLHEKIFQPLGMVDTAFYAPPEKAGRLATLYGSGLWRMKDADFDHAQPPGWPSGGGGLVSTAGDYLRFCQMMLNGGELEGVRLLGRKTVELMTLNHLKPEQIAPGTLGGGFGLGFGVVTDPAQMQVACSPGEFSWGGAASTVFWIDPVEDMIAIMMTQMMPATEDESPPPPYDFGGDLRAVVYQALVD
ncbi:MAG: beta-lactamase family protein [Anaerolineae bacterium]|nr:beta-lactamase family protein [Anaerolineae bacterium]